MTMMGVSQILFLIGGLLALLSIFPASREYPLLNVGLLLACIAGFLIGK